MSKRLSRKQVRSLSMQGILDPETDKYTQKFSQKAIYPKTYNQQRVFDSYKRGKHLLLYGYAGTGKTFLSIHLALESVLRGEYNKLVIVRSVVPTREMGFLPGKLEEKVKVYEQPYEQICCELFGRKDAYDLLKSRGTVEFMATSFIRGITLNDAIVVIDECQNMSEHELNSIITRLGDTSKLVVCGDIRQTDLIKEKSGFNEVLRIFKRMNILDMIEFSIDDIVRSGFVKEFIIAREKLKDESFYKRSDIISQVAKGDGRRSTLLLHGGRYSNSLPVSNDSFSQAVQRSYKTMA